MWVRIPMIDTTDTYNNITTLAHLVEHQIFNPSVAGSIPVCYYLVSIIGELA